MPGLFSGYRTGSGRDEMFADDGTVRAPYRAFEARIRDWDAGTYVRRQDTADLDTLNSGITFAVYGGSLPLGVASAPRYP